jgi:hypothetical protein
MATTTTEAPVDSERSANEWQWRGALNQHPGNE